MDAALSFLPLLPEPQRALRQFAGGIRMVLCNRRIQGCHGDPVLSPPLHVHPILPGPLHR